jgi:hypothetical protein
VGENGPVPIPAEPIGRRDGAATVLILFEQLHEEVRREIEGLDERGVNWSAGPGMNSIGTTIIHMVGSEAETLRSVAGLPCVRDRESEFRPGRREKEELLDALEGADELVAEVRRRIGADHLQRRVALPTLAEEEMRSGLTWLIGNYGHSREHVGHIQLTRQLLEAQGTDTSR